MKAKAIFNETGRLVGYAVKCPACAVDHTFYIDPSVTGVVWFFNGLVDKPTFIPSLKTTTGAIDCHMRVTAGKIIYLDSSTHDMAGEIIDMPEYE